MVDYRRPQGCHQLETGTGRLPDYGAGRVCEVGGCGTRLRRDHPGVRCELHRGSGSFQPYRGYRAHNSDSATAIRRRNEEARKAADRTRERTTAARGEAEVPARDPKTSGQQDGELTPKETAVWEALRRSEIPLSTGTLAEMLHLSPQYVNEKLRALHARGLVVSEGATSNRRHRLADCDAARGAVIPRPGSEKPEDIIARSRGRDPHAPPSSDTPTAQPAETAADTPSEAPPASGPPPFAGESPEYAGERETAYPLLEPDVAQPSPEVVDILAMDHQFDDVPAAETPTEAPPASGPPLSAGTIPPFAGGADEWQELTASVEVRTGSDDREVDLICTIVHELESLKAEARNRVLDYVESRYEGR